MSETCHSTSNRGPLSLQDQSFISILANLEKFPVELLSLLPKTWRIKLLRAAPPIQLYRLESTSVSKGIDTDVFWQEMSIFKDIEGSKTSNEFIATVFDQQANDSTKLEGLDNHTRTSGSKTHAESLRTRLFNYVSYLLFSVANRKTLSLQIIRLLFAVHKDQLDPEVASKLISVHIPSRFLFYSPHYFVPFRCPHCTEEQLASIVVSIGALPKALEISAEKLDQKVISKKTHMRETIRCLLRELRFLSFQCMQHNTPMDSILQAFSQPADVSKQCTPPSDCASTVSNCNAKLRHVRFSGVESKNLESIARHFAAPNGYSKLKELSIQGNNSTLKCIALSKVLAHQLQSLETLDLSFCSVSELNFSGLHRKDSTAVSVVDQKFSSALADTVSKPQFRHLTLQNVKYIPESMVEQVLYSFLTTEPKHTQTMVFKDCVVSTSKQQAVPPSVDGKNTKLCNSTACTTYKNIEFVDVDIPTAFFKWMQKLDSIYLHSLVFSRINITSSCPPLHGDLNIPDPESMLKDDHPNFVCPNFSWSVNPYRHSRN